MYWWQSVNNRIASSRTSTRRSADGSPVVRNQSFSALPLSVQKEINDIVENACLTNIKAFYGRNLDRLDDVVARVETMIPNVLNICNTDRTVAARVADMVGYRDYLSGNAGGLNGGLANSMWMSGINGSDPAKANHIRPNLYISPAEAASIYSNEGLPKRIITKKAKALMLNGVEIRNSKLSQEQLEKVNENMVKTGLALAISNGLRDGLTYGGSILYPMFKDDTPLSMTLPVEQLVRYGVVKKDCISYFVSLDRWNTVHYPQWNPTAKDFLKPKYFYVPFLGCDVHSSRIARVVPAPQPGYWGVLMTMGWGVSDITGWIEAVFNYNNVLQAIPTMIQQMSIIARTFQADGPLAVEGAMILDEVTSNETIRVREASPNNPINLDVVGKLEAIQRDFGEVSELTKLIRQDVAAKAGLKEQSLFTVEKKGMAGGGGGEYVDTREAEHEMLQLLYGDIQAQLKPLGMIQIINALGLDRDVMKALPYTELDLGKHSAVTIDQRTETIKAVTKGAFDLIAGGIPLPDVADLIDNMSGGLFKIDNALRKRLEERQETLDQMEEEKHNAEIELSEAQADSAMIVDNGTTTTNTKNTKSTNGAGHSYSSKLEQRKHETLSRERGSGTRKQGLAKAKNKGANAREKNRG